MQYTTATARINKFKGAILKHAIPVEVLGITGDYHKMPKNMSDTLVFRRWLPYGGATTNATTINTISVDAIAHETEEGVTPDPDNITPHDVTVQLKQYSCLYMYTDKMADMYEDDVPAAMKEQTGERMGKVREMIRYGALKGATNKFYAGGTSRSTVAEKCTLGFLRQITRSLQANRAKQITKILAPSPNYATSSVESAYLVFGHTDLEQDWRDLPGFTNVADYGARKVVHECELGSTERYRFLTSPELDSIADSGAAVGSTGLKSTSASNIDVYPVLVVARDAWGEVALRGMNAMDPTHIPPGKKDKYDPHGQRGYVGAKFYSAAVVLNDGWMAVGECGVTDL